MQRTLAIILTCSLLSAAAAAYEGIEDDFAICTGSRASAAKQIVRACTRLIDAAASENELVGMFYAMRAVSNNNKKMNCSDARKALELVKNAAIVDGAKKVIASSC